MWFQLIRFSVILITLAGHSLWHSNPDRRKRTEIRLRKGRLARVRLSQKVRRPRADVQHEIHILRGSLPDEAVFRLHDGLRLDCRGRRLQPVPRRWMPRTRSIVPRPRSLAWLRPIARLAIAQPPMLLPRALQLKSRPRASGPRTRPEQRQHRFAAVLPILLSAVRLPKELQPREAAPGQPAPRRSPSRRHRYYERFTASSFANGDIFADDVTAGEDPVVRQAAIDALGDMNGTAVVIDPSNGRILAMVNQKLALSPGRRALLHHQDHRGHGRALRGPGHPRHHGAAGRLPHEHDPGAGQEQQPLL